MNTHPALKQLHFKAGRVAFSALNMCGLRARVQMEAHILHVSIFQLHMKLTNVVSASYLGERAFMIT